jgi:hypothetical protein
MQPGDDPKTQARPEGGPGPYGRLAPSAPGRGVRLSGAGYLLEVPDGIPLIYHLRNIDVAGVTPRTAPRYGWISHIQANSHYVLETGTDLLLLGALGVNYCIEGRDEEGFYLRRSDVPAEEYHDLVTKAAGAWG